MRKTPRFHFSCSVEERKGRPSSQAQNAALEKPKVAGCRACGAEKRGIGQNRQNREFATWGNAAKNRSKNAAFIHAELDKRGISA